MPVALFFLLFDGTVQHRYAGVGGFRVFMGVDISCSLNISVAHKLLSNIDRYAGFLQIGTEGVPEAVWRQVFGNYGLNDLVSV